ncbi:hypothetical protein ASPZODRAFT_14349 [Penicilliopsis zonata CBS 506.65]|uniref:Glycosyl transferase family 1 domain-containing protein n=1 Tax=Penicilliopsis zonata CBS 506.65 TaxID=1073090 RepID=A0A1L9SLY0_9EURO|nr:hypothetical protein ASPZODRAFT_14349 [Penicilliopsis zonata CBS 506.65]OJJ48200.1 hypothetical protein ASPZODRAFT_14349 [Penicilliopsis zonata CBS 506.65]
MAKILHTSPVGWSNMTRHWWQFALVGILLGSVILGCLYILYSVIRRSIRHLKSRKPPEAISPEVDRALERLTDQEIALGTSNPSSTIVKKKPSSFGVYLGSFNVPPTEDQLRLLTRWDLLIVDPLQVGIRDAASKYDCRQLLGRINLTPVLSQRDPTLEAIDKIERTLVGFDNTVISGVLLAGWQAVFGHDVLSRVLKALNTLGLAVYLEAEPPEFLTDRKVLQTNHIAGLVIRNASIMSDGQKRDYFQLNTLQRTIKAFVSEACVRDFVVMAWETVGDEVHIPTAIVRRSFQWCTFYSMIVWIGTESALHDAALNLPIAEPLSAFSWLKESDVMKAHEIWRTNSHLVNEASDLEAWNILVQQFPSLEQVLAHKEVAPSSPSKDTPFCLCEPPEWVSQTKSQGSPLSMSMSGENYQNLGCLPLGSNATASSFAEILNSQLQLNSLGLLHPLPSSKINAICTMMKQFNEADIFPHRTHRPQLMAALEGISQFPNSEGLRINLCLDSGLRQSADVRFWAVYIQDSEGIEIFVSKNVQGLAGTVLHTFLSAQGFPRHVCFEAEIEFARWSGNLVDGSGLTRRIVQDIDGLGPEQRLLLLRHLSLSDVQSKLTETICTYISQQLVDVPSLMQLKEVNTVGYLDGSVSTEVLISSRLNWHRDEQCPHPSFPASLSLFIEVDRTFIKILEERRQRDLARITKALCKLVQRNKLNPHVDLMALSLFCAARKAAFDQIYTEVTDRNPLFNSHPDQAAAFAESFALGSRCEAYFDMSPNAFGKLLSDHFRAYYNERQPPSWINGSAEMATSYAGAQIDIDLDIKPTTMRGYQRFTFLSVFAIPALIDILMLSTIGRGLYLSAFMTHHEQLSATTALMISLLLSGVIGTCIACGGPYYLISMAFAAANMFVFTRLLAGFAFTIAAGCIGLIAISSTRGPRAGIVFYLYLVALTMYFSIFASLASFSYPGSSFHSGRKAILGCIPLLFISPVVTTFTGYDSIVYLVVIYCFVIVLLVGLRKVTSNWVTWYQSIRRTDDPEIKMWYVTTYGKINEKNIDKLSDPAVLKLASEALLHAVQTERRRGPFTTPTPDKLVFELARDWDSTNFLLDWYCRYASLPRPIPFSSCWNTLTKVGLDVMRNSQKGIRLHNAFIHWRQSGREIGCGTLYFIVALLDKWIELLTGGHLVGLSASLTDTSRTAVGFGLAYYLIGAVLIDTKAQKLHALVGSQEPDAIKSVEDIQASVKRGVRFKRSVYWRILIQFLMWHVWSLAFSTVLLWLFQSSLEAVVMFLAYVLAYTGLLWYQYTKIFSGPHALIPLLVGLAIGLSLGIALRICLPNLSYSSVIGLGTATWTIAILTLWSAGLRMPNKAVAPDSSEKVYHAFTTSWADPQWSQEELQAMYKSLSHIPDEARMKISPDSHPGLEITTLLRSRTTDPMIGEAFPESSHIIETALTSWNRGDMILEVVPRRSLGPGTRALSCSHKSRLHIIICLGRGATQRIDIRGNCKVIAEIVVHTVAEAVFGVPHDYAILAESLITAGITQGMARQLFEETDTLPVIHWARKEVLRQLCLGFDLEIHWESLPKGIRRILLNRCLGLPSSLSDSQAQWLQEQLCRFDTNDLSVHVARCNLGAAVATSILEYARVRADGSVAPGGSEASLDILYTAKPYSRGTSILKTPFSWLYHCCGDITKFLVTAMIADPEFQREFEHVIRSRPAFIRLPVKLFLNLLWSYSKTVQDLGLMFFLFHGRGNIKELWEETKGMTIDIKKNRFTIQSPGGTFTAFKHDNDEDGGFKVYYYTGHHKCEPRDTHFLKSMGIYSRAMLLRARNEFKDGRMLNEYQYEYREPTRKGPKLSKGVNSKIPIRRRCVQGENQSQCVQYNRKGFIEAGLYMKDGNLVRFQYHYRKNPQFGDELLRAEYVLSHISCTVSWCAPPHRHPEKADRWIPCSKVTEATFVQGPDVYESRWFYDHKFEPTIVTTLNGEKIQTPPMIEHDYLGVLSKPKDTGFAHENPLVYCESLNSNFLTRTLGLRKKRFPVSTSQARSLIWQAWKERMDLDGVTVRWMDDRLLRKDKVLGPYWRLRDRGNLRAAKKFVSLRADAIMASADLDDNISGWTPLAVKLSDLVQFGSGGDAVVKTRSNGFGPDTEKTLHVLAIDNGTWPNEGGGVSACRRDMIDSLRTIKWHMICESANDFGIPKHQTEENVHSLKVVPLWGLDFLTPTHGLFRNKLDSEVDDVTSASQLDISMNFIPILTALVKGARAVHLSKADIKQATRALVNLNTYFQDSRHWTQVWSSEVVKERWRELWLAQDMPNTIPSSQWLDTELPTLGTLDTAMDLWYRYLFIFSIPVPERIPAVFQASHHSVSASYGVVCKIQRGCTLQIWDHAISWRETNICLSSALCTLSPFVRNALLGLLRITSVLSLHHADIVSPCADFFNPGWEIEIGTCQGTIEHRNVFRRKVDPVVNGITDMQKFTPVQEIQSQRPTATMLSHVWYAKDIKTALLAADIIINQWKFHDYYLDIYGALDKAPTYSTECQEIIASKGLRGRVTLHGTADPMKVLENTWLFLNSSLSEGLPLALGEAALTGAPVVCTDVGASLRVLSDPDDFSRFSAVVAPNDAEALARAQISMLGMLGEWSQFADDSDPVPVLTSSPTTEEVARITRRMYEKSQHRRKLGMMTRTIVQKSFSGDRYLREHEQMLWIGKALQLMASRSTASDRAVVEQGTNDYSFAREGGGGPSTDSRNAMGSGQTSAISAVSAPYTDASSLPIFRDGRRDSSTKSSGINSTPISASGDYYSLRSPDAPLPVLFPREVPRYSRASSHPHPFNQYRTSRSRSLSISTAGRKQFHGLHDALHRQNNTYPAA